MLHTVILWIVFAVVVSIVVAVWLIYYKTHSKAELLIAIGWSVLGFIRFGLAINCSLIVDYASDWTLVNTVILAVGYWWLWHSAIQVFKNTFDTESLNKFREDQPGVDSDKEELEERRRHVAD